MKYQNITVPNQQRKGRSKLKCATESHKKNINNEQFTTPKMNTISKAKKITVGQWLSDRCPRAILRQAAFLDQQFANYWTTVIILGRCVPRLGDILCNV